MNRKLFIIVTSLMALLLSACVNSPPPPAPTQPATPIATATGANTPSVTPTPTLTATNTATLTVTPIQFGVGIFRTPGSNRYFSDPSLATPAGMWEDKFYVCTNYFSRIYNSYEIAKSPEDCFNRNVLGWVKNDLVLLAIGQVPESRMTVVVDAVMQCGDAIDNDGDGLFDFPSDADCLELADNLENAPLPTWTPGPQISIGESIKIKRPKDGKSLRCSSGQGCQVSVSIDWINATGPLLCVYVQPREVPGQGYYYQFEGTSGIAWIGVAPDNTPFEIIAVSTSGPCPKDTTGQLKHLPRGKRGSVTVIRINK